MIGVTIPVPGGGGVVEAGLIAGLTSAGVPQDQAVAAVFIQRLFTAYLPRSGAGRRWPGCGAANTYDRWRRQIQIRRRSTARSIASERDDTPSFW
jgi:uncharacterized membrane protein YbhN (UPF0104 family)